MLLPDYLKPPDFEVRCNEFVTEIRQKIVPKYPTIGIEVTGTSDVLNEEPKAREFMASKGIKFRGLYYRLADTLSAFENWASVAIWGWDGPTAVPQILELIPQIDEIATRYGGIKDYEGSADDLKDPDLPSAYVEYGFE